MSNNHRNPPIILDDILPVVLAEYNVTREWFFSRERHPSMVRCREAFAWLARKLTVSSYPVIAAHSGRLTPKGLPNHNSVRDQHQRAEAAYQADAETKARFDRMVETLTKGQEAA